MSRSVTDRFLLDGHKDLNRLLETYLKDDSIDFDRHSREHFRVVSERDPRYLNHGPVLALSLGGSYLKLALASTKAGQLVIHHMHTQKNPSETIHFYDLLDKLLLENEFFRGYLSTGRQAMFSVTIPSIIGEDGIPAHPSKMPTINGLLARGPEDFVPKMNFACNMERYFASRKIEMPKLYFQTDPISAHIGGMSQIELRPGEKTLQLVCGTGMATADDTVSRVLSRLRMTDFDPLLYPNAVNEGYYYERGCSGRVLWETMKRVIELRSAEPGSALSGLDAGRFFFSPDDSLLVCLLWESLSRGDISNEKFIAVQSSMLPEAFSEMQLLAALVMDRVQKTLANVILATAVKVNMQRGWEPYHVICEGSVVLNPSTNREIIRQAELRMQDEKLFAEYGQKPPQVDIVQRPRKKVIYESCVPENTRKQMDISLLGTAVLGIADSVLYNDK